MFVLGVAYVFLDQANSIHAHLDAGKIVAGDLVRGIIGIKGGTGLDRHSCHLDVYFDAHVQGNHWDDGDAICGRVGGADGERGHRISIHCGPQIDGSTGQANAQSEADLKGNLV